MIHRKMITLIIFFYSIINFSQIQVGNAKYEEKSFYLIDSLNLEVIIKKDKLLLDSCLKVYHNSKDYKTKVEAIFHIIDECYDDNVWPKYNNWISVFTFNALQFKQDTLTTKFLKKNLAYSLNNKGYYNENIGNSKLALEYYHKALKLQIEINDELGQSNSFNNIGYIYDGYGNILLALEFYTKSLIIKENLENGLEDASIYNNIGFIYQKQKNLSLASNYFKKALKLSLKFEDKRGTALSYNNIGYIEQLEGRSISALDYYTKSLKICKEIGDKRNEVTCLNNIGSINKDMGNYTLAIDYFNKGLKLSTEMSDKENMTSLNYKIGDINYKKGSLSTSKKYAENGLILAKEIGYPIHIQLNAMLLSKIEKKEGNYKRAFEMYQLEMQMKDSINNEKNYKTVINQEAKYEYQKKKSEDSIVNQEAEKVHKANLALEISRRDKNELEAQSQKKQKRYLYIVLALVVFFTVLILNRLKITQKQRNVINKQNKLVEKQKYAVEQQKDKMETQHIALEEIHKEISDSIKYAERLQLAILPDKKELKSSFENGFVLYQPKDIVSGDFYWLQNINNQIYFAVADSTGHGVPGAMVSVVCSNALNRSVKEFKLKQPKDILNKTRELVIETFARSGEEVKDGMDIALCSYSKKENKLIFSGANNPLWIVRKSKYLTKLQKEQRSTLLAEEFSLIEFKANKQPIGLYGNMKDFEQTEVELYEADTLYLFTDGFVDQFGGEKGKKFKHKPFKKILIEINKLEMNDQEEAIRSKFNKWKGELEQIDDVCVIGVKI